MPILLSRLALMSFASVAFLAPPAATAQDPVPAAPAATPAESMTTPMPSATVETPSVAVAPIPEDWAPVPRDAEGRSAYGLYLAGRAALSQGEGETGSAYLSAAEMLTPEQPTVAEQAFTSSLVSGDLDDAARIAPDGPGVRPVISEAGRLVSAVQTYASGDARGALASLLADPIEPPHGLASALVQPWIAAEAGNWDVALAMPPAGTNQQVSQVLRYSRAQLLEIRRRFDEAEAEYRALAEGAPQQTLFRIGHGAFLERRGRRDEALAAYGAIKSGLPQDGSVARARARIEAGGKAPAPVALRDGAATALTTAALAAAEAGAEKFAAVYVRLAINVDPTDERRILLGRTLAAARLEPAAREAFAQVGTADPNAYGTARSQIAASWTRQDKPEKALAEYRLAAAALPNTSVVAYLLAGQLVQLDRNEEALALLTSPVLNTADQGAEVHFMRGAAYEALGRVPEAEAELWAALQARPDEPAFLNYLGYLWVDSGTRVQEGAEMIARAHAADPQDGNIQDSLGWAQFRQGQYDTAVVTLEEAVAKEPANAEINDHLGDAYWQVGRQREAGFQWTRVLTLDPDAERRAEVEQKLVAGLTAPTPVADGSRR